MKQDEGGDAGGCAVGVGRVGVEVQTGAGGGGCEEVARREKELLAEVERVKQEGEWINGEGWSGAAGAA